MVGRSHKALCLERLYFHSDWSKGLPLCAGGWLLVANQKMRGYSFNDSATNRRRHWPVTDEPPCAAWVERVDYNSDRFPTPVLFPPFPILRATFPSSSAISHSISTARNLDISSYLELS
ncbi:hypothetical protein HOY80DRAFT_789890 [Tuber brumale]|nr:hypothetical protein HOY80DRAFT_789890 [Tuber brumale]